MASRRQSPTPKKSLALKRADGGPLTRADIQYDFLRAIFEDVTCVFSDPYLSSGVRAEGKLCFRDLYIKAIMHSPKATKALKDKMAESNVFAEDFAMLSLLVNVGRINTTMSFFPEMKTAIRTYHPIPALQRTSGNLQDAPRIKHILKTGILDNETPNAPTSLVDVLARLKAGQIPSTSVLNLIFVMAGHSPSIASHFSQQLDFLDLFLRNDISSASRGQAFLWLCYNYLESPAIDNDDDYDEEEKLNPFADARKNSAPPLISLVPGEISQENVDTVEEEALAEKLAAQRDQIMKMQATKEYGQELSRASASGSVILDDEEQQNQTELCNSKGKRKAHGDRNKRTTAAKEKKAAADKSRRERLKKKAQDVTLGENHGDHDREAQVEPSRVTLISRQPSGLPIEPYDLSQPTYRVLSSATADSKHGHARQHRYSPYRQNLDLRMSKTRFLRHAQSFPERTMLHHAWHIVTTRDPLMDSDDEYGDQHDRHDYVQRLKVATCLSRRQWNEPQPHVLQLGVDIASDTKRLT